MRGRYLIRTAWKATAVSVLDAAISLVFARQPPPIPSQPRKILLANGAHLGDVVLSIPTLLWLRKRFPDAEIGYLAGSWAKPVLNTLAAELCHVHFVDHFLFNRSGEPKSRRIAKHLRMGRAFMAEAAAVGYEVAIDVVQYLPNHIPVLFAAGIPVRIGWTSGGLGGLLTHPVDRIDADRSMCDYPRDLLARLVDSSELKRPFEPTYPPCDLPFPRAVTDPDRPYIVLHPYSGHPMKDWIDSYWRELAIRLADWGYVVIVCGNGQQEMDRTAQICAGTGPNVIDASGRLPWAEFVALIARATHVVCLDSVAQHVASGFRRPTTVIFGGMNNPVQWGPANPLATIVTHATPCRICNRHACHLRHCLTLTQPEDVLNSVKLSLDRNFARVT
jgi:ADP-heptose:LPS heptosyltransferase